MSDRGTIFMADTGSDPCAFKSEQLEKTIAWIEGHCGGQEAIIWKREFMEIPHQKRNTNRYTVISIWKNTGWRNL